MKLIQIFEWDSPIQELVSGRWGPVPYGYWLELQEAEFARRGRKVMVKSCNGLVSLWANELVPHPTDEEEK